MGTIQTVLGNGQVVYPATTVDAVIHPQVEKPITNLIYDYNVSELWPTFGTDGGNTYLLNQAIRVLGRYLDASQKICGVKVSFIPSISSEKQEEYVWYCSEPDMDLKLDTYFTDEKYWTRCDVYNRNKRFREIEETVFPLHLELGLSPETDEYTGVQRKVKVSWNASRWGKIISTPDRLVFYKNGEILDIEEEKIKTGKFEILILDKEEVEITGELEYDGMIDIQKKTYHQYPKIYFGFSEDPEITDPDVMEGFQGIVSDTMARPYNIDFSSVGYAYFFVPEGLRISTSRMNGFEYPLTNILGTLLGGNGVVYNIFRTASAQVEGMQQIVLS